MKKIMIACFLIFSSSVYPFGFKFNLFQNYLKNFGTYRSWSNGTYSKSCLEYKTKAGSLAVDGAYRIKLDTGTEFDVYCDQTTDNGGWTLVLEGNGNINPGGSELESIDRKYNACLLDSIVNCPADSMFWQTKSIKAQRYMKKIQTSIPLVAVFNQNLNWAEYRAISAGDPKILYTYHINAPSTHYLGYAGDASGAVGCQDSSIGYYFGLSNGNFPCGGVFSAIYPLVNGGFFYGGTSTTSGGGLTQLNGQIFAK